jgi:prepilin-type N-terminal cleavage/methylation domain-containing protein
VTPRAFTLVELVVAVTIVAIMLAIGAAQYRNAIEQARANVAAANLRAIWAAQRLYWLDQRTYAGNFNSLGGLIDPSVANGTPYYTYAIRNADDNTFTITATRIGSTDWFGTLTIDQTGALSGTISGPIVITPGYQ